MDAFFDTLLVIHVCAGALALSIGTIILFLRKGDQRHQRLGLIFTTGLVLSAAAGLALATIHPNQFLLLVGTWTIYLAGSGYGYIRIGQAPNLEWPRLALRVLALFMLLAGVWLAGWGVSLLIHGKMFGLVMLAFGGAGLLFVRQDLMFVRRGGPAGLPGSRHLQRMIGAYIAGMTAFLVVNADGWSLPVPAFVWWLLPSGLMVPLIVRWTRRRDLRTKNQELRK